MTRPYLIVLDEPCAGMDPGARENFLATLGRIARQARIPALIYVTHHIEEILPMFKKTLILKDGRVIHSGNTDRVLKGDFPAKALVLSEYPRPDEGDAQVLRAARAGWLRDGTAVRLGFDAYLGRHFENLVIVPLAQQWESRPAR